MKHRKYILKTCVLLVLFACMSATSAFAAGPPESQKFGVGFSALSGGGSYTYGVNNYSSGTYVGINARSWTEGPLGFEFGYTTRGRSENWFGTGSGYTWRYHVLPINVLYTVPFNLDNDLLYLRPYAGGGLNITRYTTNLTGYYTTIMTGYEDSRGSETKVGGQGFGGAEVTFKAVPKLGVGVDLGVHRIGWGTGFGSSFKAHYYF